MKKEANLQILFSVTEWLKFLTDLLPSFLSDSVITA